MSTTNVNEGVAYVTGASASSAGASEWEVVAHEIGHGMFYKFEGVFIFVSSWCYT
jgi:hypothetical protein